MTINWQFLFLNTYGYNIYCTFYLTTVNIALCPELYSQNIEQLSFLFKISFDSIFSHINVFSAISKNSHFCTYHNLLHSAHQQMLKLRILGQVIGQCWAHSFSQAYEQKGINYLLSILNLVNKETGNRNCWSDSNLVIYPYNWLNNCYLRISESVCRFLLFLSFPALQASRQTHFPTSKSLATFLSTTSLASSSSSSF